jgi:hypothetical protein
MTLTTVTVAGRGFLLNTRQRFNRIGVSPRPADASSGRLARFGSGSTTIAVCKSFSILLSIRNATYLSYWMYWPRCCRAATRSLFLLGNQQIPIYVGPGVFLATRTGIGQGVFIRCQY